MNEVLSSAFIQRQLATLAGPGWDEKKYLLAVSGGMDSMVLLHLMVSTVNSANLTVAHFNHRMRSTHSNQDESLVTTYSAQMGIKCFCERAASVNLLASEESLRSERHAFLRETKNKVGADFILTAHHAGDQLETFLMRLIRGSGLSGLKSIAPKTASYLRPLLSIPRRQIEQFQRAQAIPYREDESNRHSRYFRNRVRHELIPSLVQLSSHYGGEESFHGRFESTLAEIRDTVDFVRNEVDVWIDNTCTRTAFWWRFPHDPFCRLSSFFQRACLHRLYDQLSLKIPDRLDIETTRLAILAKQKSITAANAMHVKYSCGQVYLSSPELRSAKFSLEREGNSLECHALGLKFDITDSRLLLHKQNECRFFKSGDRFGNRKLKEIYLESRVPRPERGLLPLIARKNSSEVLWFYPSPHPDIRISALGFPFSPFVLG